LSNAAWVSDPLDEPALELLAELFGGRPLEVLADVFAAAFLDAGELDPDVAK
jgi:hypothetical protein